MRIGTNPLVLGEGDELYIFGLPGCVWCHRTHALVERHGIPHRSLNLECRRCAETLRQWEPRAPETVPQIFLVRVDGTPVYIGGYNELRLRLEGGPTPEGMREEHPVVSR